MLRAVRTIGAVESWQLTALELEMIVEIVFSCKHIAALVARVIPLLMRSIEIVDALNRLTVILYSHLWKQKISPGNSEQERET